MTAPEVTTIDHRVIKDKRDELVLAATDLGFAIAPWGTKIPADIIDPDSGKIVALPDGWHYLGEVDKKAGADLSPDMKTEDIQGYGSRAPRRTFVTEEGMDMELTVQEMRRIAAQLFFDFADEDIVTEGKVTRMTKRTSSGLRYYSLIAIAKDLAKGGELFPYWVFPKVAVTKKGKMSLQEAEAMGFPLTLTVYEDNGVMFELGIGGPGWEGLREAAGFPADAETMKEMVWTVALPSDVTGGTFTISVNGTATDALNHNTTSTVVQTALRKIADAENAVVTGSAANGYQITGTSGIITANGANLTGGDSTDITVSSV